MPRVAIALGSNLGDRGATLDSALASLRALLSDLVASSYFETAPVGMAPGAPSFLNAAAAGGFDGTPEALLAALHRIEAAHGRERPRPGASRTLDLDLVLFGDERIESPDLVVPHPRFRDRRFVLAPLAEIAADWRDPVTGLTVADLLARLGGA